jgi:hypothetical protein
MESGIAGKDCPLLLHQPAENIKLPEILKGKA